MKIKSRKQRGAVTVLLAIVLIPCLVFTCIFGDLSRIQLSAMTAESASDLALNSLLARYDVDLEEYYGLVASVQDIDEYFDVTEEYFTAMFKEQGLPDEISQLFTSYLNQLYNSQTQSTFLAADVVGEVTVETIDEGLGKSPALLEDQIVEFMKYRGPIEIVSNVITRFGKATSDTAIDDAQKDEEIIEKKQEYTELQGELAQAMFYSYVALRQYQDGEMAATNELYHSEKYKTLQEELDALEKGYAGVTQTVARYYAISDGFEAKAPLTKIDFKTPSYTTEDVGKYTEEIIVEDDLLTLFINEEEVEVHYYFDEGLMNQLISTLEANTPVVKDYITAVEQGIKNANLPNTISTEDQNQVYYCVEINKILEGANLSGAIDAAARIKEAHARLQALRNCEIDNENRPADGYLGRIEKALSSSGVLDNNTFLTKPSYATPINTYLTYAAGVETAVNDYSYKFNNEDSGGSFAYADTTIGNYAKDVADYLTLRVAYYETQIEQLETVINGGNVTISGSTYTVLPLTGDSNSLQSVARDCKSMRDNYFNLVSTANTDHAKAETERMNGEIPDIESATSSGVSQEDLEKEVLIEEMTEKITAETTKELSDRLVAMQTDLINAKEAINNLTYCSKCLTEYNSESSTTEVAKLIVETLSSSIVKEEIKLDHDTTDQYASALHVGLYSVGTTPYIAPDITGNNNPDLTENQPTLYKYMYEYFGDQIEILEDRKKDAEKENQDRADAADDADDAITEFFKGEDIVPENITKAATALDGIAGIGGVVKSLVSGNVTGIRDNILITEYIMEMFSYYSRDNQAKYQELDGKISADKPITFTNYEEAYKKLDDDWGSKEPHEFMADKNLTNHIISQENNHAYSAEVEYILYGSSSNGTTASSGNEVLLASNGSIYAIRMALNTTSAFRLFYSGTEETAVMISQTAVGIQAATSGVVPIPVTKVVIILLLAALESAQDILELHSGLPVVFIKMKASEWTYAFNGLDNAQKEKESVEAGLFYSDYLYIALLLALGSDKKDDILLRTGEVITANMRIATEDDGYSLSNSHLYYSLDAQIQVDPMLMALPLVESITGKESIDGELPYWKYDINTIRGYS